MDKIAKIIFVLIISLITSSFAIAGALVWYNVISLEIYGIFAGAFGTLCSLIGLCLPLFRRKQVREDILSVEANIFQRLAEATQSLEFYQKNIAKNERELERIKKDRIEIELLVRQESAKIFLEEKLIRLSNDIDHRIRSDKMLINYLTEYKEILAQIYEYKTDLSESEHVKLVNEIVGKIHAETNQKKLNTVYEEIFRAFANILRSY